MNPEILFDSLTRLTLLFSAGVVLIALLRPLLLRGLGAQTAYPAWLMVPLLMLSPWLPQPPLAEAALPLNSAVALPIALGQTLPMLQSAVTPSPSAEPLWLLAWGLGAALQAAAQIAMQRRYLRRLRREPDGRLLAPAGASPAVIGIWPHRLVLPRDFEQRFDAQARRLVLAHEAVHARRHDNAWNLLGAALLGLQWFNPLAWWAWRRMRDDQELACDAAVLRGGSDRSTLATYAQAMLAAHAAGPQPALASGWAARHPLVQRMRMLARHGATSRTRRLAGAALLLGIGCGAALLARAAQQALPTVTAQRIDGQGLIFELASQLDGNAWTHRKLQLPTRQGLVGSPWGVSLQAPQQGWCLDLTLHVFEDGSLRPTGQVLDETCQHVLGDWQALKLNGSLVQFAAKTAQGPLQVQLSARWVNPGDPDLPALMKAELESAPKLSHAQTQWQAQQRERVTEVERQRQAQDRAWRAAREAR